MYVHKLIHIPHIHIYPYPHTCTRTHTHVRPALFAVLTRGVPRSSTYFVGAAMTLADMGVWALCSGPSPRMRCLIAGFGGLVAGCLPCLQTAVKEGSSFILARCLPQDCATACQPSTRTSRAGWGSAAAARPLRLCGGWACAPHRCVWVWNCPKCPPDVYSAGNHKAALRIEIRSRLCHELQSRPVRPQKLGS